MTAIGYAAGSLSSDGVWLTVYGSRRSPMTDVLFVERADAERRAVQLRARAVEHARDRITVRRVEWLGDAAFRVVPDGTPEPLPRVYRYKAAQRGDFTHYELRNAVWMTVHRVTGAVQLHNCWAGPSVLCAQSGVDIYRVVD